jgi:hypothetical protein
MELDATASAMGQALVEQGIISQAELTAGLAAEQAEIDAAAQPDGKALTPDKPAIGNGELSVEALPDPLGNFQLDPDFDRPAYWQDYKLQTSINQPLEISEAKEIQQMAHAARLPQGIAQHLFSTIERMGDQPMPSEKVEMLTRNTKVKLHETWGERTDEMVGYGRRLVDEVSRVHPKLRDVLELSGAGSDPVVVRQICEHAERIFNRKN